MEYPKEAESIETLLEDVPQYLVVYRQARRAWEGAIVGDNYFNESLSFIVYCYVTDGINC